MRAAPLVAGTIAALLGPQPQRGDRSAITVDLLDNRRVVSRVISSALLLRLENTSAGNAHQGWQVEVLRRPVTIDSRNLVYEALHGPDPSDVEAWHVAEKQFPNQRLLDVKGYPITIRIQVVDPRISGKGPDAQFISGRLRVRWERRQ